MVMEQPLNKAIKVARKAGWDAPQAAPAPRPLSQRWAPER